MVGKKIKQIRVDRRETLEEFAKSIIKASDGSIKTTKSNVSKWEKGLNIPNDIALQAIADLGDTSVEFLLNYIDLDFKEFSKQVRIDNSSINQWLDDMITNYFEREKDNNNFENSYEYELNATLLFICQEYFYNEERQPLEETKNKILEQVKNYLYDDNFSGWLYSFYLFYIDDIEGVIYIDKTINEMLVNIVMENKYIYISYLEKLVETAKEQFFDNSYKIKKRTLDEFEKEKNNLISFKEHILISKKFDEILSTVRKFL